MKRTKRLISAALALIIVFSLAPAAFAEEEVGQVSYSYGRVVFTRTISGVTIDVQTVEIIHLDEFSSDFLVQLMKALRSETNREGIEPWRADFYYKFINEIIRSVTTRYAEALYTRFSMTPAVPAPAPVPGGTD